MSADPARPRAAERNAPEVEAAFAAVPETEVAEILGGVLQVMPRPAPRHAAAATRLAHRLGPFHDPEGDDPDGWVILAEPELHLGPRPDKLVPDLAGWRRERAAPEAFDRPAIDLAPDWVYEILSDRTRRTDRVVKPVIDAREGVRYLWFVDPDAQTLEAFERNDGHWLLLVAVAGEDRSRVPPFEALELDLAPLWRL